MLAFWLCIEGLEKHFKNLCCFHKLFDVIIIQINQYVYYPPGFDPQKSRYVDNNWLALKQTLSKE